MKSKDLAILVYSCWKNRDMWRIFLTLFKKYWSDCCYQLILLTDIYDKDFLEESCKFDQVVVLDSNWHDMLMEGIKKADTDYVMLMMDDYLICDYVNSDDLEYYISKAKRYHAANIRLTESRTIPSKTYVKDEELNYYEPGTAYSFSTQPGIWDADFLKKYVKNEWSAWDFERRGSIEVKVAGCPLLASKNYTFPYEEGVRRGKWMDNGISICKRNNIQIDFSKRPAMNNFELAWIYFKGGLLELNPTLIVKLQNLLQR
jgi:hypothetical protein